MTALPLTDEQACGLIQRLTAANPDFSAFAQQYAFLGERPLPDGQAGALSRELLDVLCESPHQAARIDALLLTPSPAQDGPTTIPPLLAAAFLMRNYLHFRRRPDGAWEPLVEHGPADSPALTGLLKRMTALVPQATAAGS
ncbi:hypothetical protein Thimo_2441 [Thioflavicoccus mobilis 8321]|uniref:Uncharacterized protein n=2 Tax=Thioflavicoccus mobilis TaxID=80679 RepID=L0H0R3_9GAMM|nr:hypothetical protein Thimo_2441 [Thioflavicoccus mobilis 8321]